MWVRCTWFYTLCLVSQEAVNIWLLTTCMQHTVVVVVVSQCLHRMKDFEATVHEKINVPTDPESPKCCVFGFLHTPTYAAVSGVGLELFITRLRCYNHIPENV